MSSDPVDPDLGAPEASGPAVRFEPVLPLMLSALGLVAVVFVGGGPPALGLVLLTGLLGAAGFAGWQGTGALVTRALLLSAIAFTLPLLNVHLVSHVLQWWYAIIAVYPLLLPRRIAWWVTGCISAGLLTQYFTGTAIPHVTLSGWTLRTLLLAGIGLIVAYSGAAYRTARDEARRRQLAAEHAERELHHATTHDNLTGMPNRSSLDLFIDTALHARSGGDDDQVAVLIIDLDRFKNVNETLGHLAGDRLLREVAGRLASLLGPHQRAARLGGDEFAIVCAPTSPQRAQEMGHRLVQLFNQPVDLNGAPYRIGMSVGVAVSGAGIETRADLLRSADAAMYAAKRAGRGTAVLYHAAMSEEVAADLAVEQQLREAIEAGNVDGDHLRPGAVTAVFQPVVDLATGRVVGAEALARWQIDGRDVSPLRFVPLAEELGLGLDLALAVARQSVRALAAWRQAGLADVRSVAVNISARDLLTPSLPDELSRLVDDAGLEPGALTLEITERDVVDDVERTREALQHLRVKGITVAVDDFGTGFSSLAYLARLPLQVLKIDREFVANLDRDDTIARTVVQLATSFGMECVAEGIETPHQLTTLAGFGVQFGQGWHLGRPALAGNFVESVRALAARA
ncbi:bifunctional diguanylate cyclase/phosphodiesterase [Angustibacter sp. Root456]|uniref:putative bifunctional diguanylate cyclase/phosphodiesterase n=1 Tax=Angustibacter sp. Root456 TaxID=1736539 RepID=UPI0012FA30BF|nr:EAL domain-containing protein [Angustibacter sp. Root456]